MNFLSNFDFDLKVTVLGHISTGKTSFVSRLAQNMYIDNPVSTNNVQFYEKKMIVTHQNNKVEDFIEKDSNASSQNQETEKKKYVIRLKIWDTAGSERYMSITKTYLRESNIILLFFDLNNRDSFVDLDVHWWNMLVEGGYIQTSAIILVCNKCDLKQDVTDEEIQNFCESHNNILYVKVSPKDGTNVIETIHIALQEYFKIIESKSFDSQSTKKVDLGPQLDERNELIEDSQNTQQSGWFNWCRC